MNCLKCKEPVPSENGCKAPLCYPCRANLMLSAQEATVKVLDRYFSESPADPPVDFDEAVFMASLRGRSLEERSLSCGICGKSEKYNPMVVRQGWPCERCHRDGMACCMAYVVYELKAVTMCKMCRAELELSGQSIEEVLRTLPGMENGGKL